jgi:hypothetical protein
LVLTEVARPERAFVDQALVGRRHGDDAGDFLGIDRRLEHRIDARETRGALRVRGLRPRGAADRGSRAVYGQFERGIYEALNA